MLKNLIRFYYRKRSAFWRRRRLLFPSPAELRFIEIMGGRYVTIGMIRDRHTRFKLAIILSLGRYLNNELVQREVRVGKHYVDFGADTKYYKKGIEIDGRAYHRDIIKERERDEYCAQYGWELLHIPAIDLTLQPDVVFRRVNKFLK